LKKKKGGKPGCNDRVGKRGTDGKKVAITWGTLPQWKVRCFTGKGGKKKWTRKKTNLSPKHVSNSNLSVPWRCAPGSREAPRLVGGNGAQLMTITDNLLWGTVKIEKSTSRGV